MRFSLRHGVNFVSQVAHRFHTTHCSYRAAALAFTSLLSLVPLITVSFAALSMIPHFQGFSQQIQHFIFAHFVVNSANLIQQHVTYFVQHAQQLPILDLVFLVLTALLMIFNVEVALNGIWHVKKGRCTLPALLLYWGLLVAVPVLLAMVLMAGAYLLSLSVVADQLRQWHWSYQPLLMVLPWCLAWSAFSLLYYVLPNARVPCSAAFWGGGVAMVLFEGARYFFSCYFVYFPIYQLVYGALAAIPMFLIWIYVSWLVVLLGAVVAKTVSGGRR